MCMCVCIPVGCVSDDVVTRVMTTYRTDSVVDESES